MPDRDLNCIFCKIISGELPCFKIYEDDSTVVFLDINPITPGHALVVPKSHFRDLIDAPDETIAHLGKVAKKIGRVLVSGLNAEGFNLTLNNGSAAGQIIFHLHYHVIPRKSSDRLSTWPHREYGQGEAQEVTEKIKTALK